MNITGPTDRSQTRPDSFGVKRMQGVLSSVDNKKPSTGHTAEPGILCKRIDNSTNYIDMSHQQSVANKFTPLAIPIEFTKKKLTHVHHVHGQTIPTESGDPAQKISFVESVSMKTEPNENIRASLNFKENKENKIRTSNNFPKPASQEKKPNKPEKESLLIKPKEKAEREPKKVGTELARHKSKEKTSNPPPERIKSPRTQLKKPAEEANVNIKKYVPPRIPSQKKVAEHQQPESQEERFSTNQKMLQKIARPHSVAKKKVTAKPGKNERKSTKNLVEKVEKEKSLQKDSVQRENSAVLDELVKLNAARILENLKEQKRQEEFEKRHQEERKMALEEGNRRIREANFKRFNLQQTRHGGRLREKVAWGVDQRKFSRPQNDSPQKLSKPKIDEEERRKRLGLAHLNEEQLAELKRRTLMTREDLNQSQDLNKLMKKQQFTQEEHEEIQRFMLENKLKRQIQNQLEKINDNKEEERKQHNLQKLFDDIRRNRSHVAARQKKEKKKRNKKKKNKNEISISRIPPAVTEPNDKHFGTIDSEEEENYSLLYDEYKKIIKSKRSHRDEINNKEPSNKKFLNSVPTQQSPSNVIQDERLFASGQYQEGLLEAKKEEVRKKYGVISDRFQKNIVNNIQMFENPLNRSSKHERSEIKEERVSEHQRVTYNKGRLILENERNEAQKVIIEMETDNFSENDYLRSESLVINGETSNQRETDYNRNRNQDSEQHLSSAERSTPENSAMEIIEAAAIFIQKNYRGYRTRKILGKYISEVPSEDQESEDANNLQNRYAAGGHHRSHEDRYEYDYQHDDEEEEDEEEQYLREQQMREQQMRGSSGKRQQHRHHEEDEEEEDEEEIDDVEGEGEIIGPDEDYEFLGDDEKQSLRSLLEKQKLGIHEQYGEEEHEDHEDHEDEEEDERGRGHENFRKFQEEYQEFYEQGDLKNEEEYEYEEEEGERGPGEASPLLVPPRRAKSDGEIVIEFQLGDEEEEDIDDNNISLHGEGEDFYDVGMEKNKKFLIEKREMQGRYLDDVRRGGESSEGRPSGHHRGHEESEEHHEGEEEYEGEEDEEDYDPRYDPEFQQKYFQIYGKRYEGEEDEDIRGDQYAYEEEEGEHQSGYQEEEYEEQEDNEHLRRIAQQKKTIEKAGRYEEGNVDLEVGDEEYPEYYEHVDAHENSEMIEYGDENENENENGGSEDQRRFFSQQNQRAEGDHEKMVMISTINSEESEGAIQMAEAEAQIFKNIAQRRHKSDHGVARPESESSRASVKETEERKSQQFSQKSGQIESSTGRHSQTEDQLRVQRPQKKSDVGLHVDVHSSPEHEARDHVPRGSEEQIGKQPDSEGFREELIHELSQQYQGKEQVHEEIEKAEEQSGRGSHVEGTPNKRPSASLEDSAIQQKKIAELNLKYQHEIQKLKEEEANKWNDMVSQLSHLQGVDLSTDIKNFIQHLQKQSEQNKIQLVDTSQSLKSSQGGSQRNNLLDMIEANYRHGQQTITAPPQTSFQSPQEIREGIEATPPLYKKVEAPSPLQENKHLKPKNAYAGFKKKTLQIDVNAANEDSNEAENAGLNLDLSQMRLVLGSEQLLREQSARTLSQSVSAQSDGESIDEGAEGPEGSSLFERDPFKEFTRRKFKELMQQEKMRDLIHMREHALEIRHKTHLDHMKKMLDARKFSPRTFQNKQIELEKWISKERENIQKTKKDIERGWLSTADSIQRTQRDIQFLQKVLHTTTEGRNTNASDLSLRHSFTDEEAGENAETQSERLSKRSFLNMGNEIRSPSSSKNIKIIDKFELKDHLYSPQVHTSAPNRKESGDEVKQDDRDVKSAENRIQDENYDLEEEEVEKEELGIQEKQPSSEKKYLDHGDSNRLRDLVTEDIVFNIKPTKNLIQEKRDQVRKESPIKIDQSEDKEVNPDELVDEEIEWDHDVLGSPQPLEDRNQHREISPRKIGGPVRRDLLSPEHIGSASSIYSPKSEGDLRQMIQDKINAFKSLEQTREPVANEGTETRETEQRETVELEAEELEEENTQAKTDHICREVFEEIVENFAEEITRPGNEQIRDKVLQLQEKPPSSMHLNLHNMIENNFFFNAGVEHPNFQANIQMPHSPSFDPTKLQSTSPMREMELIPEKQMLDAQAELLRTLGIKTDVPTVSKYVEYLFEEINGPYKDIFLRNINTPLGFSTSEKLNNMRNYDLGSSEGSSLAMSSVDSQLILEIQIYFKVEERIMEENPGRNEVSTELEHIHNKMLFDCVNEIFDSFRPFGLNGQPFPWKVGSKILKSQAITEQNLGLTLEKVKTKVLDWATYLCGYYGEGDDLIMDKNQSFVDEYLAQVREEKILRMLSEEIYEMENKWITYDDEEAEVELEIADLVFDKLVTETAEFIAQMTEKRFRGIPGTIRRPNIRIDYSQVAQIDNDMNVNSV